MASKFERPDVDHTDGHTNYARMSRIIVELCRDAMWEILISKIPPDELADKIMSNKNKLSMLNNNVLATFEKHSKKKTTPSNEDVDVSAIYVIIRNVIKEINPPTKGWGDHPVETDLSVSDDIERIRYLRHNLQGHAKSSLKKSGYSNKLSQIRQIIKRIDGILNTGNGDFSDSLEGLNTCHMDPEMEEKYIELLQKGHLERVEGVEVEQAVQKGFIIKNDKFRDIRYENWLKVSLSLVYMKEAIENFTDEQMRNLHSSIKTSLFQQGCLPIPPGCLCQCCSAQNVNRQQKPPRWKLRPPCSINLCDKWLFEILAQHNHLPCPNVPWDNTNVQLWPVDHWEVAKVFQPRGCANHKSSTDADAAALLTLMINCTHFHQFIQHQPILQEIKNVRNKIMHSNDMLVEDQNMLTDISKIINLLKDPLHLGQLTPCKEAVLQIEQLRDNQIDLSLNGDLEPKALRQRTTAIETDIQTLKWENTVLRDDVDVLKKENGTRKTESGEQKQEMLEKKIEKMEREISNLTELQFHGAERKVEAMDILKRTCAVQNNHGPVYYGPVTFGDSIVHHHHHHAKESHHYEGSLEGLGLKYGD